MSRFTSKILGKIINFIFILCWVSPAISQTTSTFTNVSPNFSADANFSNNDMDTLDWYWDEANAIETENTIPPEKLAAIRSEIVYRVSLGRADDVAILLKQGASVNTVNDAGSPIIALAASRLDNEGVNVLKTLVEAGADVNNNDNNGQNSLFYAAKSGNHQAAEYLVASGASYATSDNSGNTARTIAYDAGHGDMVDLLDSFVREKNEVIKAQYIAEIRKQYEITYNLLEERYKAYNKTAMDAKKSADSAIADIRKTVYQMSFLSCEAAYWQYWRLAKKPSEVKAQNAPFVIGDLRDLKDKLKDNLIKISKLDSGVVNRISAVSEIQTIYQLAIAAYNESGHELQKGTVKDMQTRCKTIASSWEVNSNK
jgi:hypothetical protein